MYAPSVKRGPSARIVATLAARLHCVTPIAHLENTGRTCRGRRCMNDAEPDRALTKAGAPTPNQGSHMHQRLSIKPGLCSKDESSFPDINPRFGYGRILSLPRRPPSILAPAAAAKACVSSTRCPSALSGRVLVQCSSGSAFHFVHHSI